MWRHGNRRNIGRKMSGRKSGPRVIELSDNINWPNIYVTGAPRRRKERGQKNCLKK